MVRFALKNPYFILVCVLLVVVLGVVTLKRIPTDLLPIFKTPAVQILTLYPGMPAEVVEQDITSRLERWTGQANGIARQESKSMVGVSVVRDYFREDIDPNTAMSQVTSLAMSDLYYLPPGTIPPMVMPFDPTAAIPLALLAVSSDSADEKTLYDIAYFQLRNRLQGISGVIAPAVYGGKLRRILAYVDRDKLAARNMSAMDVVDAMRNSNVLIPTGNAKFGDFDYQINANGMVEKVKEINDFPVKIGGEQPPVYIKDVARVEDSSQIQSNVVRIDGRRQVYIPIYRQPGANTLQIVEGLKGAIAGILERLPPGVKLSVVSDQSVFVRKAIDGLIHEGLLGGALAILMILVFLRSFRATLLIAVAIPMSLLFAFIGFYFTKNSINAMTLGGLALAVGRLLDDAIVVLENIERHLAMGKSVRRAAYDGAREVSMPVLAATITTVLVFFPVIFLTGLGKFLFTPLALAVAFAMLGSYLVSLTVVPILAAKMFKRHTPIRVPSEEGTSKIATRKHDLISAGGGVGAEQDFRDSAGNEPPQPVQPNPTHPQEEDSMPHPDDFDVFTRSRLERIYGGFARISLKLRWAVVIGAFGLFAASFLLLPFIGKELFPQVDSGQLNVQVSAPSGTRIEKTESIVNDIEAEIRRVVDKEDYQMMISNIGVLSDWPAAYTPNAGPMDAFVLLQLTDHRKKSAQEYARLLREALNRKFPEINFSFDTGGILTAALNFGLPSPINVQIEGNKLDIANRLAHRVKNEMQKVPGAVDVRVLQKLDYPQILVDVDRIKAAEIGLTQEEVVKNIVTALNSSINFAPSFWIDHNNGNHYFIGAQYEEQAIKSLETLENISMTGKGQTSSVPLKQLAKFSRTTVPSQINHLNISRVTDIFANVDGRDVGSVAADIERAIETLKKDPTVVPSGYRVEMRGEVKTMRESFASMGFGLGLAALLIYLVLIAQFRSFRDPLIIMAAVPLGFIGVFLTLFLTKTTLNIQSFVGMIFMIGIAVSNSILLVEFANRLRQRGMRLIDAARRAGEVRLRPIIMTSLAAILALLPMAFGAARGAEANIPLARAVVGGLAVSTLLTLFVVPALYVMLSPSDAKYRPAIIDDEIE